MERTREPVYIHDRTFWINRPVGDDWIKKQSATRSADEAIPYWSEIWPASRMLAKAILKEPWDRFPRPENRLENAPIEALEIACGLGLSGLAALACGLHVTFSDWNELALQFVADNARANGFTHFRTQRIDLCTPPQNWQVPVILGADLLYEPLLIEAVARFIHTVLAPHGVCWIADPDRRSAQPFRVTCECLGLNVAATFARAGEPGGERTKGTIYRITHSVRASAVTAP